MFGKAVVRDMINRSAENEADRRLFLKSAGAAGMGVVGGAALTTVGMSPASAAGPSDGAILNFALNLEYLEAEFYLQAAYGRGLDSKDTTGVGNRGGVSGGRKVDFKSKKIAKIAREIAQDEVKHVKFLRSALGGAKVSRPQLDLRQSFTAAARAAGLVGPNERFDPYKNENNFLLAAFIFEDVGVTAYKGAAPLIDNRTFLDAAAGLLAVEAYHAGIIRTSLFDKGLGGASNKISAARDSLDGSRNDDQGAAAMKRRANLVPTDKNALVYGRRPGRVLNIVYLTDESRDKGGFFPRGVNGAIRRSEKNG